MHPEEGRGEQAVRCWVTQQGLSTEPQRQSECGPLPEKAVPRCLEVTCTVQYTQYTKKSGRMPHKMVRN